MLNCLTGSEPLIPRRGPMKDGGVMGADIVTVAACLPPKHIAILE